MEIGGIAKTSAAAPVTTPARADALLAAGAVTTDLAPDAAVQQATDGEPVRFELSEAASRRVALEAALQEVIRRHVAVDPKTREIVFQSIDRRTGEVVRQVPDEMTLKLRAYAREMREADLAERPGHARVEKIA